MSEIGSILGRLTQAQQAGKEAVLATVVKVEGSAYRRPGARMLIDGDGDRVGSVSGGCLEDDVVKKAWWLTETGRATLRRYDARAGDEAQWAFGLGCNGVVHVLFERIRPAHDLQTRLLRAVHVGRADAVTAVVIAADAVEIGTRVALFPDGSTAGTLGDGALDAHLFTDMAKVRQQQRPLLLNYVSSRGTVELFVEYLTPPQRLVVFGAGHDAQPLVRLAHELGWCITVADERLHYAVPERFPLADAVLVTDPEQGIAATGIDHNTAVVVMTHSYDQDRALLAQLLRNPPRYLGQLGPRSRTEHILAELRHSTGDALRPEALHYPAGLDIGGGEPAQVALSILAEIQAVLAGRDGAMLHQRRAPIHGIVDGNTVDIAERRTVLL